MEDNKNTQIATLQDIEKMAAMIAKSGLFGMKTLEQAGALMLIAQAEGRHPASAAQDYHIIQGRPALKADAILARFQASGGKVKWRAYTDTKVCGEFSHPAGGTVVVEWNMEMAKRANLSSKDIWKSYPRNMLRARVISEAVRTLYPSVCCGTYTPEEIQDIEPTPKKMEKMKRAEEAPEEIIPEAIDEELPFTDPIPPVPEKINRPGFIKKIFESSAVLHQTREQMIAKISEIIGHEFRESKDLSDEELKKICEAYERLLNENNE